MPVTDLSTLTNQYSTYFTKKLLGYAQHDLRLNEFATEAELPKNAGSKTIRFFRPSEANAANVQSLTEGVPIATFANRTLGIVEATLQQIGEASKITDVVDMTSLFDMLEMNIEGMGNDCALYADTIIHNALVAQTTGLQIRRAANAATWTALNSDAATSYCTATDLVDSRTALTNKRAPKIDGGFVAICPAEVTRDLMKDADWLDASKYSAVKQLFKAEVGMLYGIRVIEATNAHIATGSATAADEFTFATAGTYGLAAGSRIYTSIITGKGAYGVPKLAGTQSPHKPQIIINNKADKADPLNQFMTAGWKAMYTALVLNANWGIALKSKSRFVG